MSGSESSLEIKPIGIVSSNFEKHSGTPIQPVCSKDQPAEILINEEYHEGLTDLDGFERIWVLGYFNRSKPFSLKVVPYRDNQQRGLFSCRAPSRPNPIGISCVKLMEVDTKNGILKVEGIDYLNGTPVLDVKPYMPEFDSFPGSKAGWFDNPDNTDKADGRFEDK